MNVELLQEEDVQSQVQTSVRLIQTAAALQVRSMVNFLQAIARSNTLISALNTNALVTLSNNLNTYRLKVQSNTFQNFLNGTAEDSYGTSCAYQTAIFPAAFFSISNPQDINYYRSFTADITLDVLNTSVIVNGFFVACTALDALLSSTLDCLYQAQCLNTLAEFYPKLKQVCLASLFITC